MTVQEQVALGSRVVHRPRRPAWAAPMQEAAARIIHDREGAPLRHLMVTGVERRVGASLIARGLAETLCGASGRVLLIEVRDDVEEQDALARLLDESMMMSTPGCTAITLAGAEFGVLALCGRAAFETHSAVLLERFDLVVWDVPPADSAPGSVMAAPLMDGITLVVRADHTRARRARQAAQRLQAAGGHLIGVVMNRTRPHLPRWLDRLL